MAIKQTVWTILTRFWEKVDLRGNDECWPWTGAGLTGSGGYGQFSLGGKAMYSHRFAYLSCRGPIPDGLLVRHSCDNRACCNPAHLSVGNHRDNWEDARDRGRSARGERVGGSKLTETQVREIRALFGFVSQTHLAELYGITKRNIRAIGYRESWRWLN